MLNALFDFSFSEFITTRLVRFIYGLSMIGAGIGSLMFGFGVITTADSFGGKLLGLVWIPLVFFLVVGVTRLWLEVIMVVFRIAENTKRTADLLASERSHNG